jgi:basic amino acid/polyamine antiporter, APA family
MSAFIVVNTLIEKPVQAVAGLAFLVIGVVVFYTFKKPNKLNGESEVDILDDLSD